MDRIDSTRERENENIHRLTCTVSDSFRAEGLYRQPLAVGEAQAGIVARVLCVSSNHAASGDNLFGWSSFLDHGATACEQGETERSLHVRGSLYQQWSRCKRRKIKSSKERLQAPKNATLELVKPYITRDFHNGSLKDSKKVLDADWLLVWDATHL